MRAMAVTANGEALIPIDVPEPDVPNGCALLEVLTRGVCFQPSIVGLVRYLDEVNDAFSILLSGEVVGRAVLDIAGVQS
jgi:D-arabinose 1-dehydrogenase-like Zn-dependent alcohol dehydrogenase